MAAGIKPPLRSDAVLWARKDYEVIFGPSAGVLAVPEIRPIPNEDWRHPLEETLDEEALDDAARRANLPRDTEALDALESLTGVLLDGFDAIAKACTGERTDSVAERAVDGASTQTELDELLGYSSDGG